MKIAVVSSKKRGETDQLISDVAIYLRSKGIKLAGIVKIFDDVPAASSPCDMTVQVLPDGPIIPITQDLGEGSTACRLDSGAIARAVGEVEKQPIERAQIFILNKFGPEEVDGRGFRNAIGTAFAAGIPVLVGVGAPNRPAFDSFVDGLAATLPPEAGAIRDWCEQVIS
jgi:hypothetical protein